MPSLTFPSSQVVGTLDWPDRRATRAAPVLAYGIVTVPDDAEISLDVMVIESVRRSDESSQAFRSSQLTIRRQTGSELVEPVTLESSQTWQITGSRQLTDLEFLRQLPADSITNLYLRWPIVAESFAAVMHLALGLRRLYLAHTDLTDAALVSVARLSGLTSQLTRIGIQDMQISDAELADLRRRLTGVQIDR